MARRQDTSYNGWWWRWMVIIVLAGFLIEESYSKTLRIPKFSVPKAPKIQKGPGSRGGSGGGGREPSSPSSKFVPKPPFSPPTKIRIHSRPRYGTYAGIAGLAIASRYHHPIYRSGFRRIDHDYYLLIKTGIDDTIVRAGFSSGCDALGFSGAKRNECGYCVGEATGLPEDYGKDCKGQCHGIAVKDCNGTCGGTAYIDECTGECTGSKTEIPLEASNRDCSGLCIEGEPIYSIGGCGICSLQGDDNVFRDCANTCQLPGMQDSEDAAKEVCNTCVGGASSDMLPDVLDECGNCKSEKIPCPCNGTTLDACGECGGDGSTCLVLKEIWPPALPNKTEAKAVTLKGAFKGSKDVGCLFVSEQTGSFSFPGNFEGQDVICKVTLPIGRYNVYAKLTSENSTTADIYLYVYGNEVVIKDMEPKSASYLEKSPDQPVVRVRFSGENLLDLPLVCNILGPDWPFPRKINGSADDPHSCDLPYPEKSMVIRIKPTFNGENMVSKTPFKFVFNSPPIKVHTAYASDDGSTVQVIFDRPVDIANLKECKDILTSETIEALGGEKLECRWATKHQLSIYLFQALRGDDPVTITIKPRTLKEHNQKNAEVNEDEIVTVAQQLPSTGNPMLVITGPNQVPQCGKFALVGHFTSPEGRATNFSWSVTVEGADVSAELLELVEECQSSVLVLEASLMEVGLNYNFKLLTVADQLSGIEASHDIVKLPYDAPIVTIYSSTLLVTQPISQSEEVELISEVIVPDCVSDVESVKYIWSVDNPKVYFNWEDIFSPIYIAKPYSLPPNSTVTFTLTVFMGTNYTVTSATKASVTIVVAPIEMKAKIQGGQEIVVGTDSGTVKIDGTMSMDRKIPLVYQWSCMDELQQPCYDYNATSASSALLIARDQQKSPVLEINSTQLKPDSKLIVGLQVFHANDPSMKSDVSTILLNVTKGSKPQLMLKAVYARGEVIDETQGKTGAYAVPAGAPVMIYAYVIDSEPETCNTVDWKIEGFPYSFNTGRSENETYLSIDEGVIVDHGVYVVTLEACCASGCSTLKLSLNATPGVLLCQVLAYPYIALNWTHVVVDGCSVPLGRAPLTYQLFVRVKNRLLPITVPQFASMLNVIGPPVPPGTDAIFCVEVCDKLDQCRMFNSDPVKVEGTANETESLSQIKRTAAQLHAAGDSLAALAVISVVFINQIVETSREEVDLAMTYATTAIEKQELTPGQVAVMYAAMMFILDKGDYDIKMKSLSIIEQATNKTIGQMMTLPVRVIQEVYEATSEAFKQSPDDKDIAKQVKKAQSMIVEMAASQLPLGQKLELKTEGKARPITHLYHGFLDKAIVLSSETSQGPAKATVKFGHELRKGFSNWDCNQREPCQGAVAAVTLYPEHSPFPGDDGNRLTPIVSITLRVPGTGAKISVKDVDRAVSIVLTQISNKTVPDGQIARCHYWDEILERWSLDGVKTLGTSEGSISCYTTHLTSFAVLQIKNGLTAGTIAGIVVAVLMGITIFAVMIVLFVHQKQNSSTHVSSKVVTEPTR